MANSRTEALQRLLDDLEAFHFTLNEYFDDAEPAAVIDAVLSGKINTLRAYCRHLKRK